MVPVLAALLAASAFAQEGKTALDVHCHLACYPRPGSECFVSPAMLHSWKYRIYLRLLGVTQKELEERGDGIVADRVSAEIARSSTTAKAVVLALDGAVKDGELDKDATEVYVPNEFVAGEVARHDNLLFGASVNPKRKDALERLHWAKEHGAVLIKWIPSIMGIDPSDPTLAPFYRKLAEYKLPLLVHTGAERTFTRSDDELCDPARLEFPLRFGVTVIAAHMASTGSFEGERGFDRLLPLFAKYKNLYADVSATTQFNRIGFLKKALRHPELRGRLLYGTDWPLQSFPVVWPWYQVGRLSPAAIARISRVPNVWDRDVALKKALGVPDEVFAAGWSALGIPAPDR
jgi:predicted TIM-barrel fold metal-dependent hydrolase